MRILADVLLDYLEPKYAQHFSIPIRISKKIVYFPYPNSVILKKFRIIIFIYKKIHTLKANGLILVMLLESRTSLFRYFNLENTIEYGHYQSEMNLGGHTQML